MAKKTFFVTGTDTDAGKTLVSCGLLAKAGQQGLITAAMKPVSAGCEKTEEGLRNGDAVQLIDAMSLALPYDTVNPIAFEPPIAPHIAAMQEDKSLQASRLVGFCRGFTTQRYDFGVIEGAGGWLVPLNPRETIADIAKEIQLPVILVVGMKLGCISHALLTARAIEQDGLRIAGWVANLIDPDMSVYQENLMTLSSLIQAPLLGEVPFLENPSAETAAEHLNLEPLFAEIAE